MELLRLGGRLDLPDETSAAISGLPLSIENMFVEPWRIVDSRLFVFSPFVNTELGPNVMGVALLILPNCDRSPALGAGRDAAPPATAHPSGPTWPSPRSPPRLEPPRDMLRLRLKDSFSWAAFSFAA